MSAVTPYSILDQILRSVPLEVDSINPSNVRKHAETFVALAATEYHFTHKSPALIAVASLGSALRGLNPNGLEAMLTALQYQCGVQRVSFFKLLLLLLFFRGYTSKLKYFRRQWMKFLIDICSRSAVLLLLCMIPSTDQISILSCWAVMHKEQTVIKCFIFRAIFIRYILSKKHEDLKKTWIKIKIFFSFSFLGINRRLYGTNWGIYQFQNDWHELST